MSPNTLDAVLVLLLAAALVLAWRQGPRIRVVTRAISFLLVVWLLPALLALNPAPGLAQQIRGSAIVAAVDRVAPPSGEVLGRIVAALDSPGLSLFGGGRISAPPVPQAAGEAVRAAAGAGQPGTVQIRGAGCGALLGFGSGFVVRSGFVVTNAHVVAGFRSLTVRDTEDEYPATPVYFDEALDVAVLAAPGVAARPIAWTDRPAGRGTEGATLGFPGGQPEMVVRPATVRARLTTVGPGPSGTGPASRAGRREILALAATVQQGDSGGPFVTREGRVAGVVFAGDPNDGGNGFAITAEQVRGVVDGAIAANRPAGVGACRV